MGQCLCTLCSPLACCVGAAATKTLRITSIKLILIGALLGSLGIAMFIVLTLSCGGVNFFGPGECWSAGFARGSKHSFVGLLAAVGIGLGFPLLAKGIYSKVNPSSTSRLTRQNQNPQSMMNTIFVTVPANVQSGQLMQVNAGAQGFFMVTVPPNCAPGQQFPLQVPTPHIINAGQLPAASTCT